MVSPVTALENFFMRALNVSGRASRAEYWWMFLIQFVLAMAAMVADIWAVVISPEISLNPLNYWTPWFYLITVVPQFTLTLRRIHDTGRSGLWFLIAAVPIVGGLWLLFILVSPSEREENAWGQPPRGDQPSRVPASADRLAADAPVDPQLRAMQGYAMLTRTDVAPSPEEMEARRAQIADYYRRNVLKEA